MERGISLVPLAVTGLSTGLYGRACVSVGDPKGRPLAAHRLGPGDQVRLYSTKGSSSKGGAAAEEGVSEISGETGSRSLALLLVPPSPHHPRDDGFVYFPRPTFPFFFFLISYVTAICTYAHELIPIPNPWIKRVRYYSSTVAETLDMVRGGGRSKTPFSLSGVDTKTQLFFEGVVVWYLFLLLLLEYHVI